MPTVYFHCSASYCKSWSNYMYSGQNQLIGWSNFKKAKYKNPLISDNTKLTGYHKI